MGRPLERLKPIGFWSYARQDDEMSDGRLSRLRYQLANELQLIYGKQTIRIFQDVAAIPPGTEWEKAINAAIDQATFFIPILTPAFVESEWCCREVSKFLEREAAINAAHPELHGQRRIFPIRYIGSHNADPFDPEVFAALDKLQELDFQSLRREGDQSPLVRDKLVTLADTLAELLQIKVQRPPTAAEIEEERQQRETAAEQRRITEANQLAEERRQRDDVAAEAARQAELTREQEQAAAEHQRVAEVDRVAKQQRLREEAERDRQREAERAAQRAATMRALVGRVLKRRVLIIALGLAVLALVLLVHFWPSSAAPDKRPDTSNTLVNVTAVADTTANSAASVENARGADVRPTPPATPQPDWIKGNWEVVGQNDGCVVRIAISSTDGTLSFGRAGSDRTVDTKFTFDPAQPNMLLTNGNRYEKIGGGEIRVTPRRADSGNESRLRPCVP